MEFLWLVIPAALALFALRTLLIGRKLRLAAAVSMPSDARALRVAKEGLAVHKDHLDRALAAPKEHLAAAKGLSRSAPARARASKGVDAIVQDFLPERRL